jgi:hypothetical protein
MGSLFGKPSAPNPATTTQQQTQSNQQTAITQSELGHVNQTNPYGSLTYQQTGTNPDGTPIYSSNTTLSAPEQAILGQTQTNQLQAGQQQQNLMGQISNEASLTASPLVMNAGNQPVLNNSGNLDYNAGNVGNIEQESQNAAYQNQMGYLDPQFKEQNSDLTSQLAAQGITQGSDAYNRAMSDLNRNQTFSQQQAESSAVNQGLNAAQTAFGMNLNNAQLNNNATGQAFNQELGDQQFQQQNNEFNANLNNSAASEGVQNQMAVMNEPLSQWSTLAGGSQPNMPNFNSTPAPQVSPTNVAGIYNQAYQNQLGAYNGTMSGLGGLVGAGMSMFGSGGLKSLGGLFGGGAAGGGAAAGAGEAVDSVAPYIADVAMMC